MHVSSSLIANRHLVAVVANNFIINILLSNKMHKDPFSNEAQLQKISSQIIQLPAFNTKFMLLKARASLMKNYANHACKDKQRTSL
jgi:hypothetical protein